MLERFSVYHTSNAGLLVQMDDVKILIDSLYQEDNRFSPLSGLVKQTIFEAEGVFSGVDCVLFTHGHYDHYDYQTVRAYKNRNSKVLIAGPECIFAVGGWTGYDLRSAKIINFGSSKNGSFKIKDVEVLYFRTSHLGFEFPHFGFHYSFIIRKNEEALFVSGDAEMRNSLFRILKSHGRLKAAFFNPFVLVQKSTRDTVQKLNIEKKVIYHLPSEEYDPYSYRKSTIDVFSRHREELQGFELLLGDLEKVF